MHPTAAASPPRAAEPQGRSLLDSSVLPWALAAYGVFSAYGAGELAAALRELHLTDTDDAMRLVEVRDLVAGQSWLDMVQHRFLPPAGVASHWSRLLDAPLAAGIAALASLLGTSLAERVTTALWPVLLFLAYAAVLLRGMRGLFNGRAAVFAIFAATQTIGLMMQFTPGRIDHHNVQVLLLASVALSLMQPLRSWRPGLVGGVLAAGSLAVGLEALPLVAIAGLIVAAEWWLAGRAATPALLGFGLGLAAGATLLFGLQTAPGLWSTCACDALSPPWLWLAWTGAALALAAAAARPERRATRLGVLLGIGGAGLAGFAALFPDCLHGPFTGMPSLVRLHWLEAVREMQPLGRLLRAVPAEAVAVGASLFAATAAAIVLAVTDAAHRRCFVVAALFLAAGAVQSCFQMRGLYVAYGLVPLVAGVCLDRALPISTAAPLGGAARFGLLAAVLALNAHVWLAGGRSVEWFAGIDAAAATAATATQPEACTAPAAFGPLAGLPAGTVLAPIDLGPFLLVHTPHAVVAAPYHRAIAGLIAGIAVGEGTEAELRRQAAATGATYLVLCAAPDVPAGDGGSAGGPAFSAQLNRGEVRADWLEPIPLGGSPLKAWRVR